MHRVLTFPRFHQDNEASESINKRLCCSFLLTTAFLSIIGGFLLGRYTTEKAMLMRQARLCGADDEKRIDNNTRNLSNIAKAFTILSRAPELNQHSPLEEKLYYVLQCRNYSLPLPNLDKFKSNVQEYSNIMLNIHIETLTNCVNNASMYVQQIIKYSYDTP